MDNFSFFVNVASTNTFFDPFGSGPITSVARWSYTAALDRAGRIEFEFDASDPQAAQVTNRRAARAYAFMNGAWAEVGIGIINKIETAIGNDGRVIKRVSGMDIIGELYDKNVRTLEIGAGTGASFDTALTALNALAPVGWLFNYIDVSVPENDYFYAKFDGESLLGALIYLADKVHVHFYRDALRSLNFSAFFVDSGIAAIQAEGELRPSTCAITSLTRTIDSHDLLTRIYPYGSGDDRETSLTLSGTSRSAPVGYTLDTEENFIENNNATATYGLIDFPEVAFKEITPITNTNADYQAAADFLFDVALAELQRRSSLVAQETYDLSIAGCSQLLKPLQTIRVMYYDPRQGIDINQDLYILEATWEMDSSGIRTSRLKVSTHDTWPKSSNENASQRAVQTRVFQAHPQLSLNEYWKHHTLLVGPDTTNHVAELPFVLGASVVMIKQVTLRFKVISVLGTGYTYALADDETGDTNIPSSGAASITNTQPSNVNTGPESITNSGVPSTGETGMTTVTVNITGGTATDVATTTTVTLAARPDNTATISAPTYTASNYNDLAEATQGAVSSNPSEHAHQIGEHVHEITEHYHPYSHDHGIVSEHGHSAAEHNHSLQLHTHTIAHAHTLNNHSHDVQHTHTMPHTHDAPDLLATFGITRGAASRTYAMSDLEYAVNGGSFEPLESATGTGDGYFELDLTTDVTDPLIPFRPAQTSGNNKVEIRRKSSAGNLTISTILGTGTVVTVTTSASHGLGAGDQVTITGTTNYNGTYIVTSTPTGTTFTFFDDGTGSESSGTVNVHKTAMILAELGVRTVITAVVTA